MKPEICVPEMSKPVFPADCENSDWLVKVKSLTGIKKPNYDHAYELPDNSIWVLDYSGNFFIRLKSDGESTGQPTIITKSDKYLDVGGSGTYNVKIGINDEEMTAFVNEKYDLTDKQIAFVQAAERKNIESGENLQTLFGKIRKWFSELAKIAFSGLAKDASYNNEASGLEATDVQGAIDELCNNSGGIFCVQEAATPSLNSSFTLSRQILSCDVIVMSLNRYARFGSTCTFPIKQILDGNTTAGTRVYASEGAYWEFTISIAGVVTLTALGPGTAAPAFYILGIKMPQ